MKTIIEFPEYSVNEEGKVFKGEKEQLQTYDKVTGHVFVLIDTWLIRAYVPIYKLVAKYYLDNPNKYESILFKNAIFNDVSVGNLEFVPDDYEK